jgi:hypothetical protein
VCLEGDESGTYFRGSGRFVQGRATVDVPKSFRLVTEADGLTVQLTSRGRAQVWVESVDLDRIVVASDADVAFDYFVNGVRRGFAGHEPVQPNRMFVPQRRDEPYGAALPPAVRQMLVDNGILNPDFTPNEVTAARMGWPLADAPPPDDRRAPFAGEGCAGRGGPARAGRPRRPAATRGPPCSGRGIATDGHTDPCGRLPGRHLSSPFVTAGREPTSGHRERAVRALPRWPPRPAPFRREFGSQFGGA